ncbi:hypothetical protein [Photobacterium damselae]
MDSRKISLGLGSGLIIGTVATVLPMKTFALFVIGMALINYSILKNKKP